MTDPTPEELVERLRAPKTTKSEIEQTVAEVIADAEAGGAEHMQAVAGYIASLPPGAADPRAPRYDAGTGRPAFHDTNVLLECRVRVEGRVFTAREAVDPMMWAQLVDRDDFERYITFWLRRSFGEMASGTEGLRFFRDKTLVVLPDDEHDLRRCARSAEDDRTLTAICWHGQILRPPVSVSETGLGTRVAMTPEQLGACPCRCHKGPLAPPIFRVYGPHHPVFDEDRFDG